LLLEQGKLAHFKRTESNEGLAKESQLCNTRN